MTSSELRCFLIRNYLQLSGSNTNHFELFLAVGFGKGVLAVTAELESVLTGKLSSGKFKFERLPLVTSR